MTVLRTTVALVALLASPTIATADDVVLHWNRIAVETFIAPAQSPFAQALLMSNTQLAVFEAVNAITHEYEPYLGTIVAPAGESAEAAAIEAAYRVLFSYFPANPNIGPARTTSLAAIPDGQAKTDGMAVGAAAAAQMVALRANDGSSPPAFFLPTSTEWAYAAYHDQAQTTDWVYPTQRNTTPTKATASTTGSISNPGANVINYGNV